MKEVNEISPHCLIIGHNGNLYSSNNGLPYCCLTVLKPIVLPYPCSNLKG
jgi:hypothetical protein